MLSVFLVLGRPLCLRTDLKSTFRYTRQGVDTSDCFEKGDLLRKYKDTKASGGGAQKKKTASSGASNNSARAESRLEFEFVFVVFFDRTTVL